MVPTRRFEAWRDGLEDVAYMDLLQKAVAEAKAKGKTSAEAQALLDARKDVMSRKDQKTLDAWRLEAGRAIDRLSGTNNVKRK
jgi:hypothetical protein